MGAWTGLGNFFHRSLFAIVTSSKKILSPNVHMLQHFFLTPPPTPGPEVGLGPGLGLGSASARADRILGEAETPTGGARHLPNRDVHLPN